MKVLVACEFSGVVRDAFIRGGHDAMSCDLLSCESLLFAKHYKGDLYNIINRDFDLIIAHPPCTHLCVSGARWFSGKIVEQAEAMGFFMEIANAKCERIAIENPIGIMSTRWRKPDQIVQPWMFGHGETKATCLWLKGLPALMPTDIVDGREPRIHWASPGPGRWKERSRTYTGLAKAMADQWGSL